MRQEHSRGPDDGPARLEQQMHAQIAQGPRDRAGVSGELRLKIVAGTGKGSGQAASCVHIADGVARGTQTVHQIGNACQRGAKRAHLCDLRADVHAHSRHAQVCLPGRCGVKPFGLRNGHAEFMVVQSGGNVGMCFRRQVRIHAQGHGRHAA